MKPYLDARRRLAAMALALPLAVFALGLMIASAFAADAAPAPVAIPWGDWLATIVAAVGAVLAPLLLTLWRAASFIPGFIKTAQTEQLLTRAIDYGLAVVEGAAKGKVLEVNVANDVLRQAAQYAVDHGAPWLLSYIGDLGPKLAARLSGAGALPPDASAANLNLSPVTTPAKTG